MKIYQQTRAQEGKKKKLIQPHSHILTHTHTLEPTHFRTFLLKKYEDHVYAHILVTKVFYCSIDNTCKKFYVMDGCWKIEDVPDLYGYHLEADTRLDFHILHADSNDPGNIVVRAINMQC